MIFFFAGYHPEIDNHLFQELLKYNILNKKWSKVFTQHTDKMPKESVSNAVAMKDDVMVVNIRIKSLLKEEILTFSLLIFRFLCQMYRCLVAQVIHLGIFVQIMHI